MINYNEYKYDLPLQPRSPFTTPSNTATTPSKDLPRQLANDFFPHLSTHNKENRPTIQPQQNTKTNPIPHCNPNQKTPTAEKIDQKGMGKERSDHLRDMIRKQLYWQTKDLLDKIQSRKDIIIQEAREKPKQENKQNRYKKLLSQFYGDPTKYNKIHRQNKKGNPIPPISRHQSMKKLGEPHQQALNRNYSNCSLKANSFLKQKPSMAKQPSYLELYWQRRSPQLSL